MPARWRRAAQPLRRRADARRCGRRGRCSAGSRRSPRRATSTGSGRRDRRVLAARAGAARRRSSAATSRASADHREQVGPVHRRRHVEHLVDERQHVGERRPRLEPVRQQHDPGVVGAEPDLVLGEDHPPRGLAAERPLLERPGEAGQERAGQPDRDGRARRRSSTRRRRSAAARGCRRRPGRAGAGRRSGAGRPRAPARRRSAPRLPPASGDADVDHPLDLERRDREPPRHLVRGRAVSTYSRSQESGNLHQNCLAKRRSFRQSSRRSGNSWRSIAMRSRPEPEREARVPLGVVADELEELRVDHPRAAELDPARVAADGAARAVADVAGDVRLDRRLGEREVVRPELRPPLLAEQRLHQRSRASQEVGERDPLVDREPLDLVEDRRVRRVRRVAAVDAAERDDVDGRLLRLHRPDLRRGRLRAEQRRRRRGRAMRSGERAGCPAGKLSPSKL